MVTPDRPIIKDTGVRIPISDEIVLDWYALTEPFIRDMNPSLRDYAERLLEERSHRNVKTTPPLGQ